MPCSKLLFAATLACAPVAHGLAQTAAGVDKYSTEALVTHGNDIGAGKGLATDILARYPNHYLMLTVRHADGQSEFHEHNADVIFVLEGEGTLITGGSMVGAKTTDIGEQRGSGIAGGVSAPLKKGDIVHIPAGVPHQVKLAPGASIEYFVVKVDQDAK